MNPPNWSFDKKIKFWSVLGPILFMVTLLVGLFKARPESLYLHLIGVVCLPLCIQFKKEGLYASLSLLFVGIVATFFLTSTPTFVWQSGLALAIATTFIVTTLSFDEVEALTDNLVVEAKSKLNSLLALDEKFKKSKVIWEGEKQELTQKIDTLAAEHRDLESLYYSKGDEASELKKAVTDERTLRENVQAELAKEKARIEAKEKELQAALGEIDELNQRNIDLGKAFARNPEIERLRGELDLANEKLKEVESRPVSAPVNQEALKQSEEREKQLERQLKRCQGMLSQLQEQFSEKSKTLADTRTELFEKEGELHVAKKELDEFKKVSLHHLQKRVDTFIKNQGDEDPQEEIERLHTLVESLMQELAEAKKQV